ncbi:RHS repeat-associated core domain-containing protein [Streptomyces sp. NPDC002426]
MRLTTKGTAKTFTGTRYYSAADKTIAVRTAASGTSGSKLSFLAADHHGTSSIATDATTQAVTKRYSTPFGDMRGDSTAAWPDDKAFLGKPADATTGLTHIGAREYDPKLGQFISVDPALSLDQHQSLNGYAYANNNPVTTSDPTGLRPDDGSGGRGPTYFDGWFEKDKDEDVDDIRSRFGNKYDDAITEMWVSLSPNRAVRDWAQRIQGSP